jgi:four helix bundle protein
MGSAYRGLTAYRLAASLADDVHRAVKGWSSLDQWTLGAQLRRAADSVGANIAEAAGREHPPDRRRFLVIARSSLLETEHWLQRAHARGLLASAHADDVTTIARALSGLIRRER